MVMSNEEILEKFGLTKEELDILEDEATRGILRGKPVKTVYSGRPLMFGEKMRQVGFKEPETTIAAIDARAKQLGMKRSDYLRYLVAQDLASASTS